MPSRRLAAVSSVSRRRHCRSLLPLLVLVPGLICVVVVVLLLLAWQVQLCRIERLALLAALLLWQLAKPALVQRCIINI